VVESSLINGCEIWTADYRINKKLLITEIDFWRGAARTFKMLKLRKKVTKEKISLTQTDLERMENNMLKCYGNVLRVGDNRWSERILTWSPEGRKRRGRPEMKWEREVERAMK